VIPIENPKVETIDRPTDRISFNASPSNHTPEEWKSLEKELPNAQLTLVACGLNCLKHVEWFEYGFD
jgi:hypothetical protein